MISKENFYKEITWKMIRDMVKTALSTKELGKDYLTNENKKGIDLKIDELSKKATDIFILKLKKEGYLEDKEPSEEQFGKLLKESISECFARKTGDNPK